MAYYNRNFKKFDQSNFEYLNRGNCAYVDYNKQFIFKQYYPYTSSLYRLKACVFAVLKDIDNPHFIKLIDIYRNETLLKSIFDRLAKKDFIIDAYSAKYYEGENINVLKEPTDYLLDNIRELEILFGIFSDNAILTDDLHSKNIIFTSQSMIIIDPDLFNLYQKEDLIIRNKERLLRLCKNICESMLKLETKYTKSEIEHLANKLTNFELNEKTDISYEIAKKLKNVKKPIDYLLK